MAERAKSYRVRFEGRPDLVDNKSFDDYTGRIEVGLTVDHDDEEWRLAKIEPADETGAELLVFERAAS